MNYKVMDHLEKFMNVVVSVLDSSEMYERSIVELFCAAAQGGQVSTDSPETSRSASSMPRVPDNDCDAGQTACSPSKTIVFSV